MKCKTGLKLFKRVIGADELSILNDLIIKLSKYSL